MDSQVERQKNDGKFSAAPTVTLDERMGSPLDREMHRSFSRRQIVRPSVRYPTEFRILSIHVTDAQDRASSKSADEHYLGNRKVPVKGAVCSLDAILATHFALSSRRTGLAGLA